MVKLKFANYFLNRGCKLDVTILLFPFLELVDSILKLLDRVVNVIELSLQVFLENYFIFFMFVSNLMQFV